MLALLEKLRAQSPRQFDVLGLGECSLDQVVTLPGRLRDFVGGKGRAVKALKLGGGQVATALCAAARLGWRGAFLGAVGADGEAVLTELHAEGINTQGVHRAAGALTRSALLLIDEDGERTVIEHRDPALTLPQDYPPSELVAQSRVLHVDATYLAAALRAARAARLWGTLVSIDVDALNLQGESDRKSDTRQEMGELLALADLCVVPAAFALAFTHQSDLDTAARRLAKCTAGQVVVTLGAAGSLAVRGATIFHQAALKPSAAVLDTTACGDTFRGALLAYLLEQADGGSAAHSPAWPSAQDEVLAAGLYFASAVAALKCQGYGRSGCPKRSAVDEFLQKRAARSQRVD